MRRTIYFEAMPNKWINQSRQTGRGPPDAETNVIGGPSADILIFSVEFEKFERLTNIRG